jgi:hypothetical protein
VVSFKEKLEVANGDLKTHVQSCRRCKKALIKTTRVDRNCKNGRALSDRVDELLVFVLLP